MVKKLEYAYPSSTLYRKAGLWQVLLKSDKDIIFDRNTIVVYSNNDELMARGYFDSMSENKSKYSL